MAEKTCTTFFPLGKLYYKYSVHSYTCVLFCFASATNRCFQFLRGLELKAVVQSVICKSEQLIWFRFLTYHFKTTIHRMQIWQITRSSPGTSCMKVRLVRPQCFVLTVLPHKSLASWTVLSVLFRYAY